MAERTGRIGWRIIGGVGALAAVAAIAASVAAQRGAPSSDREALVEARLRGLEARVAMLEDRLRAEPERRPAPETEPASGDLADDPRLSGVSAPVRAELARLYPRGRVVEVGESRDDGYWWFEVRDGGRLHDVEISIDGAVIKNRRTRD